MRASEIIKEIEAQQKLISLGWTKKTCEVCKGTGYVTHPELKYLPQTYPCFCSGGYTWEAPITK